MICKPWKEKSIDTQIHIQYYCVVRFVIVYIWEANTETCSRRTERDDILFALKMEEKNYPLGDAGNL
jgi:hypothetical protein